MILCLNEIAQKRSLAPKGQSLPSTARAVRSAGVRLWGLSGSMARGMISTRPARVLEVRNLQAAGDAVVLPLLATQLLWIIW